MKFKLFLNMKEERNYISSIENIHLNFNRSHITNLSDNKYVYFIAMIKMKFTVQTRNSYTYVIMYLYTTIILNRIISKNS